MKLVLTLLITLFSQSIQAPVWLSAEDIPESLAFPVVAELRGNIHVIGGGGPSGATDLHLRYTPSTNKWDTLPPVPYLAQQPAGATVNDKIHYCGGGYPNTGTPLNSHYYYDPDSNQWYQAASLPNAAAIHKAVELNGKLYVLTGQPNKTLCEYYDPLNDTWYPLNPLPDQNFWYGAVVSANNTIYRFGGGGYTSPTAAAHKYDVINDDWVPITNLPVALHGLAGTNAGDSVIWITGGYTNGYAMKTVWSYNIASQTYTLRDSLPIARDYHGMVTIGPCIYAVGGHNTLDPDMGTSLIKNCTVSTPNSIAEVESTRPYSLIKTPQRIDIQWHLISGEQIGAVKLVDISGRMVFYERLNNSKGLMIDGNGFSPGLYIVLIAYGEETYTEQWMINK